MSEERNPFDYTNAILDNKTQLIVDDESEKAYQPFLVNRALSQHLDLILHANEMNLNSHLDKKLQFDYFLYGIKKIRRKFAKWPKAIKDDDIKLVSQYYSCSYKKAKEYYKILNEEQMKIIKKMLDKGGTKQ